MALPIAKASDVLKDLAAAAGAQQRQADAIARETAAKETVQPAPVIIVQPPRK